MDINYTSFCNDIQNIDVKLFDEKYVLAVDNIITAKYGYIIKSDRLKMDPLTYTVNLALCIVNKNMFETYIVKFLNKGGFEKIKPVISIKDMYNEFYNKFKKILIQENNSYDKLVDELLNKQKILEKEQEEIDKKFPALETLFDKYDDLIQEITTRACDLEDRQNDIDNIIKQMDNLNEKIKLLPD